MNINSSILEALKKASIPLEEGLNCLLSVYYGLDLKRVSYIPEPLILKLLANNILENKDGMISFSTPLFEEQVVGFEWVKTEYVPLFKAANPEKAGHVKECITRFKKLFARNPTIRKDDVIAVTKYYISQTDYRYLREPHYFIEKGVGSAATFDLEMWYERWQEASVTRVVPGGIGSKNSIM